MSYYNRIAILSPHLDDAVFSCGGLVASSKNPSDIFVINIFTGGMNDERFSEEKEAAEILGYNSILYSFPEVPRRGRLFYHKPDGQMRKKDIGLAEEIFKKIKGELVELGIKKVYVPLAVGYQIDHLLAFYMGLRLAGDFEVLFYEDVPYSLVPNLVDSRIQSISEEHKDERRDIKSFDVTPDHDPGSPIKQFGFRVPPPIIFVKGGRAGKPGMTKLIYQRFLDYIRDVSIRTMLFCLEMYLIDKWSRLYSREKTTGQKRPRLLENTLDIEPYIGKKLEAMFRYKTQSKYFFKGPENTKKIMNKYSLAISSNNCQYVERTWKLG